MLSLGELYASISTEEGEQSRTQIRSAPHPPPPKGMVTWGQVGGREAARSAGLPEPPEEEEERRRNVRNAGLTQLLPAAGGREPRSLSQGCPPCHWERDGWCECS